MHRCLSSVLLLLIGFLVPAWALTIVRQDGSGDYTTISDALFNTGPGEEVRVTDGATYNETVNVDVYGDILTSVPPGATINTGTHQITLGGIGPSTIEGFNINTNSGIGIDVWKFEATTSTVRNCVINAGFGFGIRVLGLGTGVTGGVVIENINLSNLVDGIRIEGGDVPQRVKLIDVGIRNCLNNGIRNETPYVLDGTSVTLSDNQGAGIDCHTLTTLTLRNARILQNQTGILAGATTGDFRLDDCVVQGNSQYGLLTGGIAVLNPARIELRNTTLTQNTYAALRNFFPASIVMEQVRVSNNGNGSNYAVEFANASQTSATLRDVLFSDNSPALLIDHTVDGFSHSTITLERSRFLNNFQEGLRVLNPSAFQDQWLVLRNVRFEDENMTGNGHLKIENINARLENCLLDRGNNSLIDITQTAAETVSLSHCTLFNPSSVLGIALSGAGTVRVRNSIIDVGGGGGVVYGGFHSGTVDDDYNLTRGGIFNASFGPHTVSGANPLFINPKLSPGPGNYRLAVGSPAAGIGLNGVGPVADLDGNPRPTPAHTPPDAGAYEGAEFPVELSGFMAE